MELNGIVESLQDISILITGSSGFLAKVFVEKVLRIQPNVKRFFLVVRAADTKSASQRMHKEDYEKLSTAYKMEEDVVIAKLNAEKHKDLADRYDISGYPMVKFFPKHNKDGEDYDGELDLEDFILFINEHCGTGRDPNGKLTSDAGIVESLHLLVKDFVSGSIDEKKIFYLKYKRKPRIWKDLLKGTSAGVDLPSRPRICYPVLN